MTPADGRAALDALENMALSNATQEEVDALTVHVSTLRRLVEQGAREAAIEEACRTEESTWNTYVRAYVGSSASPERLAHLYAKAQDARQAREALEARA